MKQIFTNNASSTLAADSLTAALTLEVQPGEGALFPSPAADEFFMVSLEDDAGNLEICQCTSRAGDVLTVTRARENTTARDWTTGDRVECRLTAGTFDEFLQRSGATLTGNLDADGNEVIDPIVNGGETRGTVLRGSDGGSANELSIPAAGAAPTIGGDTIWHGGNDGAGSSLDADLLDGQQGSYYEGLAADASNLTTGTLAAARLPAEAAQDDQKNGWSAGEYTAEVNLTATSTTTVNADLSNAFDINMTNDDIDTLTLSNMDNGQSITLLFRQGATPNTCAFPAGWRWKGGTVGVLTATANAHDIVVLTQFNSVVYAAMLADFS